MMEVIEIPPNIYKTLSTSLDVGQLMDKANIPSVKSLIEKANNKYLYWTDVKHRVPEGAGVTAEELWLYIKLGRNSDRNFVPASDKDGKNFSFIVPKMLIRSLSDIDKWSGGVIETDQPNLGLDEKYVINSLMDEAIASSQLEGATTEYAVAKEMLRTGRKPKDKHEKMIVNNWMAMRFIKENVRKEISIESICELHTILTHETLNSENEYGKLRKDDDIVVKYRDKVVHIPPKAETLNARMETLCEFANNDSEDNWIHPVIKGAIIHFWLAYDHPFNDGNGRTARALMYWYLLSRGYALFKYLSISKHFLRTPGQYVRAYLHTEHDGNDLTYFLVFNLDSIRYALNELRGYIKRKQKEISQANSLLSKFRGLNLRQKGLIYHTVQHPNTIYTIEAHKNTHGLAYETARKDLLKLVVKGFLKKQKEGKRKFIFLPTGKAIEKLKSM